MRRPKFGGPEDGGAGSLMQSFDLRASDGLWGLGS